MESKNIKIIDEHSIDREASIICKFTYDNNDYVLYFIERDNENDNLFTSKLVNNNDGTSTMVNIDDSMEKSRINEVVKELVTYSIKSEAEKVNGTILIEGKEVKISNVLFNKEQSINVGKTYVTTVKKAVTKVSVDFYSVKDDNSNIIKNETVNPVPVVPEIEKLPIEDIKENIEDNKVNSQELNNTLIDNVNTTNSEVVNNDTLVSNTDVKVEEPVIDYQIPVEPVIETPHLDSILPTDQGQNDGVNNLENSTFSVNQENTNNSSIFDDTSSTKTVEPILPVGDNIKPNVVENHEMSSTPIDTPVPVEPILPLQETSSQAVSPVVESNELIFDGSKESNLNIALGEVTSDTSVKVDDVSSFREFGQDDTTSNENQAQIEDKSDKKGFANNKFFMVIAVLFFIAACVFLGYEVFRYFQITK